MFGYIPRQSDYDSYQANFWLLINCTASLDNVFKEFKIISSEEFINQRPTEPLSGSFIHIIGRNEYDKYATEILSKYYPEALEEIKS